MQSRIQSIKSYASRRKLLLALTLAAVLGLAGYAISNNLPRLATTTASLIGPSRRTGRHTYELTLDGVTDRIFLEDFIVENADTVENSDLDITGTDTADLYIENLTLDGVTAKTLDIKDSEIVNITAENVRADGVSYHQTPEEVESFEFVLRDTYPSVEESDYSVDKVSITGDSESYVESLTLKDFEVRDTVTLQYLVVENLTLKNIRVGSGNGLATKDFVVSNTLVKNEVGMDIQEELIEIK